MEEENRKPHRKDQCGSHWSHGADKKPGDKCTGKRCRSWAAAAIADCVALCCCPCAVVNFVTLALVKVPWKIGRKCIGRNKKPRKKINGEDGCHEHRRTGTAKSVSGGFCGGGDGDGDGDGEGGLDEQRLVVEREEETSKGDDINGRVEAERVWLELYQIGHHLGFGFGFDRLSSTGNGNGNGIHHSIHSLVIN